MRTGRHVVHSLHAHVVFVTKYRRGAFTGPMLIRGEQIMKSVPTSRSNVVSSTARTATFTCWSSIRPSVALSRLVNSLKGVSARMLRKEFCAHIREYLQGDHFWSGSYFAGSVGGAPLTVLKRYIEQQKRPA
ncbi:IS200/IS605 family transposase [Sphaerisporangium sp. NPDC051011]|uniref:IS200/IS605 family transposase n=1 Tax=Sphaerisporangium sp. NPDC051011 TaxID=3155792 RepID=UPI0033EBD752